VLKKIFFLGWVTVVSLTGVSLGLAEEKQVEVQSGNEVANSSILAELKDPFLYRWGVGLRSSYFQTTDSQSFRNINRMDEEQDYTPSRISLSYRLYELIYLEGEVFLKSLVSRPRNRDVSFHDGDLEWTPYFLTLQVRIPTPTRFQPYLSFGLAYIRTEFETQAFYKNGYDSPEEYSQIFSTRGVIKTREFTPEDHIWGVQFGAGADYYVTKHISLNLDFRYLVAKVGFNYRIYEGNTLAVDDHGSFNLDTWILGFGLRYSF
jgi:opacity protein-like surface antigen